MASTRHALKSQTLFLARETHVLLLHRLLAQVGCYTVSTWAKSITNLLASTFVLEVCGTERARDVFRGIDVVPLCVFAAQPRDEGGRFSRGASRRVTPRVLKAIFVHRSGAFPS